MEKLMTEINLKEKTPEQCLAEYCHRVTQEFLENWLKSKQTVIIEPFTKDMTHIGYCKCGYLVNEEWNYCPKCGRKIQWSVRYE